MPAVAADRPTPLTVEVVGLVVPVTALKVWEAVTGEADPAAAAVAAVDET